MLQKWDELNSLQTATRLKITQEYQQTGKLDKSECIDLVLDLLISAYVFGVDDVDENVEISSESMRKAIYREISGETFVDRISRYVDEANGDIAEHTPVEVPSPPPVPTGEETVPGKVPVTVVPVTGGENPMLPIIVVADTESHRCYGEGEMEAAKQSGKKWKTWITMHDEKVRDTHSYLHGITVGIDERFYAYDDDSARFPGDFEKAKNNVNCRCALLYT